jgi:hypothetical protein
MARRKAEEKAEGFGDSHVTDVVNQTATAEKPTEERQPGDEPPKKKWTPPENPFGFENKLAGTNRVRLLKSEWRDGGAWVIRFDRNPNEGIDPEGKPYSKENPHPALKHLKDKGHNWNFDVDGKGGWGKLFSGDPYGQDHAEAREVLAEVQKIMGQSAARTPF